MPIITITSPDYTIESFRAEWADDASLTPAQVDACADAEYAWLVLSTRDRMRGWSFTGGAFTGPAQADAITIIGELLIAATDHVLANFEEIIAEADDRA